MTKADLVTQIAIKASLTKAAAERLLNATLDSIQAVLVSDGKLTLTGFATFIVEDRKKRKGRNPRTGEEIEIPASRAVKFRPGKALKEAVK